MRLWSSVFDQYGNHLCSDGAGGPGEGLPAALRAGGWYALALAPNFVTKLYFRDAVDTNTSLAFHTRAPVLSL